MLLFFQYVLGFLLALDILIHIVTSIVEFNQGPEEIRHANGTVTFVHPMEKEAAYTVSYIVCFLSGGNVMQVVLVIVYITAFVGVFTKAGGALSPVLLYKVCNEGRKIPPGFIVGIELLWHYRLVYVWLNHYGSIPDRVGITITLMLLHIWQFFVILKAYSYYRERQHTIEWNKVCVLERAVVETRGRDLPTRRPEA